VQALSEAGLIELSPNQKRGIRLPGRTRQDVVTLPVLGRVAAGQPIGADIGIEQELQLDRRLFSLPPDYLLKVQGDSMIDDGILDGDLVGVHRSSEARDGQTVVARIDEEITIKRLERGRRGIRLLPRNPAHAPIEVRPGQDFAIEGIFCGLVRGVEMGAVVAIDACGPAKGLERAAAGAADLQSATDRAGSAGRGAAHGRLARRRVDRAADHRPTASANCSCSGRRWPRLSQDDGVIAGGPRRPNVPFALHGSGPACACRSCRSSRRVRAMRCGGRAVPAFGRVRWRCVLAAAGRRSAHCDACRWPPKRDAAWPSAFVRARPRAIRRRPRCASPSKPTRDSCACSSAVVAWRRRAHKALPQPRA
jgi:repressor LexA